MTVASLKELCLKSLNPEYISNQWGLEQQYIGMMKTIPIARDILENADIASLQRVVETRRLRPDPAAARLAEWIGRLNQSLHLERRENSLEQYHLILSLLKEEMNRFSEETKNIDRKPIQSLVNQFILILMLLLPSEVVFSEEDLSLIKKSLENGADPTVLFRDGLSLLYLVVYHPSQAELLLSLFLSSGANPNIQGKDGQTALHHAVRIGSLQIAELLLNSGADPNVQDEQGRTALEYAAIHFYSPEIVDVLISSGANPNIRDQNGHSALHHAVRANAEHKAELLLNSGADPNVQDQNLETPLHLAIRNRFVSIARLLLNRGSNPNAQNIHQDSPLLLGVNNSISNNVVQLMLDKGASSDLQNQRGETPLMHAASKHHEKFLPLLERAHLPWTQDANKYTALHYLIMKYHAGKTNEDWLFNSARSLLKRGVDPNIQTSQGNTALHFAAIVGATTIIKLLLQQSNKENMPRMKWLTSPNIQNNLGFTALDTADIFKHKEAVSILQEHTHPRSLSNRIRVATFNFDKMLG